MKDLPSKAMLRAFADAVAETTEEVFLVGAAGLRNAAAKFLYDLAREQKPDSIFERLDGRSVTVRAHALGDGELFSWVGPRKITEAIKNELGIDVQPNQVILSESFHELGVFDVSLRLEGAPKIKVWIVQEAPDEPEPEPEEPEKPKVETLREAAARFNNRRMTYSGQDAADLCAIVLCQVDRLAGLTLQHRIGTAVYKAPRDALRRLRAEIAQMREGSE